MKLRLSGAKLTGIQLVLPSHTVAFDDEIFDYSFSAQQSAKLKAVMGYNLRRVVKGGVTSSDLVVAGFQDLVDQGMLDLETLDALIVVTQTPDYLIPGTSYIIHGRLRMKKDMLCLDINQGCAGFITGLMTSFSVINQMGLRRVALVNVDVASRLVASGDRNSRPIVGDAASITVIDATPEIKNIHANLKVDGRGWDALMVPAGGMKIRPSSDTAIQVTDTNGNTRSQENLVMKGDAVFNFVMAEVPPMISSLIQDSGKSIKDVDQFFFHQPNPFMLRKLAEKLGIPSSKMPSDLVPKYGNSSGVSIPALICTTTSADYFKMPRLVCMAGFGVGLTWGSILMPMNDLLFVNKVEI